MFAMAWESCVITLNSDSTGSLYTGDIVTGTVSMEFKHQQNIESIDFSVIGISKAKWVRPSPTIPHIKFYSEKKKVLHIELDVFEEIKGKTISPDVYTFPFYFALPEDLPSTFESSIAKVNYYIKIKSRGVWGHKKITKFVVVGNVNVNHIERYLEPSTHNITKTCWNNNWLSFHIKTYTAFASKQSIPFHVKVFNKNNVKLLTLCVMLIQKLHYNIKEGYSDEERKMFKTEYENFSNDLEEICDLTIEIPHVTPSSLHIQDPTINISYVFRVAVKFVYHRTVYEDIPVIIATAPVLHHDFDELS